MKNRFFYFVILLLAVCLSANANDFKKKRKKQETTPALADALKKEKTEDKSYDKVITKEARTKKGLITLHMVKSTFYMEIPVKLMGKPMLFAGRVAEISDNKDVVAGQMPQDPMLVEWSAIENRPYDQTSELYYELTKQYQRYMGHCMAYIGGLYLNHPVAGDEQKGFVPVSREKQKEVVKFFFDEFKEQPKWMAKKEIMTLFEPNNDMVANLQANLLRNLLNSSTLGKVGMNAKYSERPYTQKEYLNDLYQGVWNKTEQGKALDYYDRNLQYAYVQYLLKELELTKDAEKSKGLSLELLTEDHLPCYGYEYHRHARQMSANTKISDLGISSKTLYYGQLVKLKELLKNRRHSASGDDKVHYDYLYFELNSALK